MADSLHKDGYENRKYERKVSTIDKCHFLCHIFRESVITKLSTLGNND